MFRSAGGADRGHLTSLDLEPSTLVAALAIVELAGDLVTLCDLLIRLCDAAPHEYSDALATVLRRHLDAFAALGLAFELFQAVLNRAARAAADHASLLELSGVFGALARFVPAADATAFVARNAIPSNLIQRAPATNGGDAAGEAGDLELVVSSVTLPPADLADATFVGDVEELISGGDVATAVAAVSSKCETHAKVATLVESVVRFAESEESRLPARSDDTGDAPSRSPVIVLLSRFIAAVARPMPSLDIQAYLVDHVGRRLAEAGSGKGALLSLIAELVDSDFLLLDDVRFLVFWFVFFFFLVCFFVLVLFALPVQLMCVLRFFSAGAVTCALSR